MRGEASTSSRVLEGVGRGPIPSPGVGLRIISIRSENNFMQEATTPLIAELTKATWVKIDLTNSFYKERNVSIPSSTFRIKNQQHKITFSNW